MKTAVEIYKLLPKTNCGKCGLTSCFGFAARLATRQSKPEECPPMAEDARETLIREASERPDSPGTVYADALELLKKKIKTVDFKKAASVFRAVHLDDDRLELTFLNQRYTVTKDRILDQTGKEARPWISILIYNHLCMPDPPPPSGEWVSFGAIPQSHAKDKAWIAHVEEVIARNFEGIPGELEAACERNGGRKADIKGSHDVAYEFRFFPRYPALLIFWDEVAEEGFPAQCKLLLDRNAPRYLDIESIVVLGEVFVERLIA